MRSSQVNQTATMAIQINTHQKQMVTKTVNKMAKNLVLIVERKLLLRTKIGDLPM